MHTTPFGNSQIYSFRFPGLTMDQATKKAMELHREISSHEMKFYARLPADDLLTATAIVEVEGTGTKFDQTYFPVSVSKRMSMTDGYTMTVQAKNHSPESEPSP